MGASLGMAFVGAGLALACGCLLSRSFLRRRDLSRMRQDALARSGVGSASGASRFTSAGLANAALSYQVGLEQRIAHGATRRFSSALPSPSQRAQEEYGQRARYAGVRGAISLGAVREARLRLALLGCVVGVIAGVCISNELGVLLGLAGMISGARVPMWAITQEARERSSACKRELPELLEVVSLGLGSGLTFDRSFGLYHAHFDTGFARACADAQRKWSVGLASREEALRDLAASYDSQLLKRVVDNIVRSMKYGTSLAAELEKAAEDSHAEQRAARQEEVAKAPVKMMVPTATLILPAMLILVLGPVLLELMQGF